MRATISAFVRLSDTPVDLGRTSRKMLDIRAAGVLEHQGGELSPDIVMIAATGWLRQLLPIPESACVPLRYQVVEYNCHAESTAAIGPREH